MTCGFGIGFRLKELFRSRFKPAPAEILFLC